MAKSFDDILEQIDEALRWGDVGGVGRIFFEATEAASGQGMITDKRGRPLGLSPRADIPDPNPQDVVESGTLICLVMEDEGHKTHRQTFVQNAERYLTLLMKYAATTLTRAQQYKVLKPRLILYVQSGAHYGALILARAAVLAIKFDDPLEAVTMYFNLGSIQVHLQKFKAAHDSYKAALDLALRQDAPADLVSVIRKNLNAVSTGYDPDFMFLPDSALQLPENYTMSQSVQLDDVSLTPKLRMSQTISSEPDSMQLVLAARANEFDTVRKLLKQGCDVNTRDGYGSTALMYAVGAQDEEAVKLLFRYHADVNLADAEGKTALIYSIVWQCPAAIVKLLIDHGADASFEDRNGNTPLMLAMMFSSAVGDNTEVIELLRNAGKRRWIPALLRKILHGEE